MSRPPLSWSWRQRRREDNNHWQISAASAKRRAFRTALRSRYLPRSSHRTTRSVGERTSTEVIRQKPGADPSAVVFDALTAAKARKVDYVIVDTAAVCRIKPVSWRSWKKCGAPRCASSPMHRMRFCWFWTQPPAERAGAGAQIYRDIGRNRYRLDETGRYCEGWSGCFDRPRTGAADPLCGRGRKSRRSASVDAEKFIESLFSV